MKSKLYLNGIIFLGMIFFFSSCDTQPANESSENMESDAMEQEMNDDMSAGNQEEMIIEKAICVLHPTEGNNVSGTVTFTRSGDGVKIVADLEGLSEGKHGFHVHQYGDCTDPEGKSAGGHFNPEGVEHAGPDDEVRHVGDLGNVTAGSDGKAHYERVDNVIQLDGENSILGRAIIVHQGEDDLESQPTGSAGARVACGVIGIANGE